ncbi:MAG: glycosyltransferase [Gemmatimonadaceae bacterium]|nr:glycosyltransferase [Gemmatimonadaceae bacterium]NUQ94465.1 glycosyltransferase [Gemmatimonadaceae bacterium]NUR18561.1 glycosyltransferase [Gemmatimonadaceae bacterium]NUS97868.1 glycosyltransferase [Gemmatimonadaceae bacterium]
MSLLQHVVVEARHSLADYAAEARLAPSVQELEAEASRLVPLLAGRTIWMVSSTAVGGGVAEMLPTQIAMLRDLGIRAEWVVIGSEEEEFFVLTKHLHNLVHGVGTPALDAGARALFERVNHANAEELRPLLAPNDVLVVHDPQPLPIASMLARSIPLVTVWRCHIGLDEENAATRAAWDFFAPWLDAYDHAVFSASEYIPPRLAGRASVIAPGIDPLSEKNAELSLHETVEALARGGLAAAPGPLLRAPFAAQASRAGDDGVFVPAATLEDIGLLTRPIVTQISRWDRLKGWLPLLNAFTALKRSSTDVAVAGNDPLQLRRLQLARLVLAGPDPGAVADDPEGLEVLGELRAAYAKLPPAVRRDVAFVALPMTSREENALMVNALQRASTIVVQNSRREGFGLTIAEAMWKRVPVLSNSRACGPRQQIRDGIDGRLIADPEDVHELCETMVAMLGDQDARERWGRSAQRRVQDRFVDTAQLRHWVQLLLRLPGLAPGARSRAEKEIRPAP